MKKEKIKSISSSIFDFISTFFTTVIVIIAVAFVAFRLLGLQGFTVESNSMAPKYPINSFLIVEDVAPNEIEIGDVITYVANENGMLVTHRVVSIDSENKTFITKGDSNNIQDPSPILWGNMVGKVVYCIPKVGSVMRIFTDENNRIYIISAIVAIGVLSLSWDITEKKRKNRVTAKSEERSSSNNEEK